MRTLPLSLPFARYFRFLVLFTARRNALIASAVLAIATPSVRLSVCIDEVRTLPLSLPKGGSKSELFRIIPLSNGPQTSARNVTLSHKI